MGTYYLLRKDQIESDDSNSREKYILQEKDELRWSEDFDSFLFYKHDDIIELIAGDGGEPEDQTFIRAWAWVVVELNRAENRCPPAK